MNITHTPKITAYSAEGAGVARLDNGCVVFVEGGVRGDVCEISVTKALKRACFAKIQRIITPSPHRIDVDCKYFGQCGGCDFRHISYEEELYAKRERVNDALRRIGGLSIEVEGILTTGKINGYRNNIHLKTDGEKFGFYGKSSHEIIEIDKCLLACDEANRAIRDKEISGKIRTSTEVLDGLTFNISPDSFFQVNTGAALLLYNKAREYADLKPREILLDLYCGTGSITLFLARDIGKGKAIGVEINAAAIADAKRNAALNGVSNVEFLCKDVSALKLSGEIAPDCIVVDPPRRGLTREVVGKIAELSPKRLVYISCDPATLARDIKLLSELSDYAVKRVCAVDMFPRTRHVECVALLESTLIPK